jgi:transcriptional regulator with XRE-family HTH domain
MESLGRKISENRRAKGWTQEELAEKLGVSPQAVSKWENDLSCPDIMLLPAISKLFGCTVDGLLQNEVRQETIYVPEEKRKSFNDQLLKVIVNTSEGDRVRINLPMPILKLGIQFGMSMPQINGNEALKGIDFNQILDLVENGLSGKIVEVESTNGDLVEIVVE